MIDKVRRAAEWLGDLAEKAKAVSAAVGTFAGVVVVATADDALGLDEVPTLVTAAVTLASAVYAIVWRTPNAGHVSLDRMSPESRKALHDAFEREKRL